MSSLELQNDGKQQNLMEVRFADDFGAFEGGDSIEKREGVGMRERTVHGHHDP